MSKEFFEAVVSVTGRRAGTRYYEDLPLNVPVDLATGNYERLSDLQVREFINDMLAEELRRNEVAARQAAVATKCGGYDPFASQIRRTA